MEQLITDISGCVEIFNQHDRVWPEGQMVWLTGYYCPPKERDRESYRKNLWKAIDAIMTYEFLRYDAEFVFQWSEENKGYRVGLMNMKPFRVIRPSE
jgi:hypothetical protein